MIELYPNPGVIPTLPEPKPGEKIIIEIEGHPPYKDTHFSIRNPKSRQYKYFMKLRNAAINAMAGRKWYDGPVMMEFTYFVKELDRPLNDYGGGYLIHLTVVMAQHSPICLLSIRMIVK